jgi:hypothetical protein
LAVVRQPVSGQPGTRGGGKVFAIHLRSNLDQRFVRLDLGAVHRRQGLRESGAQFGRIDASH